MHHTGTIIILSILTLSIPNAATAGAEPAPEVLAGADALIGLCTPSSMNNATPRLLWLHNFTVGMDRCANLPEDQVEGRVFSNSKRLSGPAIAQHSIAMMLSLVQGLPAYQRIRSRCPQIAHCGRWTM